MCEKKNIQIIHLKRFLSKPTHWARVNKLDFDNVSKKTLNFSWFFPLNCNEKWLPIITIVIRLSLQSLNSNNKCVDLPKNIFMNNLLDKPYLCVFCAKYVMRIEVFNAFKRFVRNFILTNEESCQFARDIIKLVIIDHLVFCN